MANFPTIELQLQELEQEITRNCLKLSALTEFEFPISYWKQVLNLVTNQEFLYKLRIAMLSAQTAGFHNTTTGKLMLGDLENVTKNKETVTKQHQLAKEQMERDGRLSGAVLASQNYMKLVHGPTPNKDGDLEYYDAVSRHSDQEDWEILDSASQASEKWEEEDFDGISDSERWFTCSSTSNPYESKNFDSEYSDPSDNDTTSSDSEPESNTTRSAPRYETDKCEEFDNYSEDNASEWESSTSDNETNLSAQTCGSRTSDHQTPNLYITNNNNTTNTTLIDTLVSLSVKPKPTWPWFINAQLPCSTFNPMNPSTKTQASIQPGTQILAPTYDIDDVIHRNVQYVSRMQQGRRGEWRGKGKLGKRDRVGRLILEKQLKDMEEVVVGRGIGGAWFDYSNKK